ncbi:MAG: hypothetical protein ACLFO5_06970 [Opitutales bacterium]
MADKSADSSKSSSDQEVDLNSLSGLDLAPSWVEEKPKREHTRDETSGKQRATKRSPSPRDRRPKQSGSGHAGGPRDNDRRSASGQAFHDAFEPTVEVNLYPQDEAFDALIARLRASSRTYQLFEITRLLLEKYERFIVVVENKRKPGRKEAPDPLFFSVPDHLPFETEEGAVNHVLQHHLDRFFDIETVEVEPPKGNFQMVNRCSITGEILGPPNYHRYQEFLKRHFEARITSHSYEQFLAKIETVKDQETIDAWIESMKQGVRYSVKDRQEGEPETLQEPFAVKRFLLDHRKDLVVGSSPSVRFAGRDIERLPKGDIRRSVEHYVEQQRRFPLDSANNIRGRLRRHKFAIYKNNQKGVTYVCAVKRQFRDSKTVFTDAIRDLIEFIEKHPNIPASQLPKQYLGIDMERPRPEDLKMEGATPENPEGNVAPSDTETGSSGEFSPNEREQIKRLMADLRWLITEGYVTEYGDGTLYAPPPMPEPKKRPAGQNASSPSKDSDHDETVAPSEGYEAAAPKETPESGASQESPAPPANHEKASEEPVERTD